jgi:hypothetical protein
VSDAVEEILDRELLPRSLEKLSGPQRANSRTRLDATGIEYAVAAVSAS